MKRSQAAGQRNLNVSELRIQSLESKVLAEKPRVSKYLTSQSYLLFILVSHFFLVNVAKGGRAYVG